MGCLGRDIHPQQREKELMESKALLFPQFSIFPYPCRVFALEQRFLLSSAAAMKSCPQFMTSVVAMVAAWKKKIPLLLLFKGNYSACPRSKAPGSWDVPLRRRETQTEPKNSNIWISWVTARLSCARFPICIIQGLFLKLQGANSGCEASSQEFSVSFSMAQAGSNLHLLICQHHWSQGSNPQPPPKFPKIHTNSKKLP